MTLSTSPYANANSALSPQSGPDTSDLASYSQKKPRSSPWQGKVPSVRDPHQPSGHDAKRLRLQLEKNALMQQKIDPELQLRR